MRIVNGYTIWARKTTNSEIFYGKYKPAMWFKIWFYLVNKANHTPHGKWGRGQCFITYNEIEITTGATHDQVKHCIVYLKKENMLATKKATRGMNITIIKYDFYQTAGNYGATGVTTEAPQKRHTINNNEKNNKETVLSFKKNTVGVDEDGREVFEVNGKKFVRGADGEIKEFNGKLEIKNLNFKGH